MLVLQDPPRGRGRRSPGSSDLVSSGDHQMSGHQRSGSDFDPELQRALELSRLAAKGIVNPIEGYKNIQFLKIMPGGCGK